MAWSTILLPAVALIFSSLIKDSCTQSISSPPVNTAAKIGVSAPLNCTVDMQQDTLEWRHFIGAPTGTRIYASNSGTINDPRFDVLQAGNGEYDLVIKNAQSDLAGLYQCGLIVEDVRCSAEFVTVSTMSRSPTPGDRTVVENTEITLSCVVTFNGYKAPTLEWYNEAGARLPTTTTPDENDPRRHIATTNLTARAEHDMKEFECRLRFEQEAGETAAAPTYTDHIKTHFMVEHAVTGIVIHPDPDKEVDRKIRVEVGDQINCTGSGRPEPSYYWYSEDGSDVVPGQYLEIRTNMVGEHTYTCVATNRIMGVDRKAEKSVTFIVETSIEGRIDTFINGILQCTDLPGVVLSVVNEGETFITKGYGVKDVETREPMTDETLVLIASVSKAFTSTMMAKTINDRADQGITWTSKVRDFLPEWFHLSDPHRTEEVTIVDLLSHKTGLPRHDLPRTYGHTVEELVRRMQYLNFTREFREVYKYNNLMYGVASFVMETLAGGVSWEDQLIEKLLTPLGMSNTSFITRVRDRFETDLASVYLRDDSNNLRKTSPEVPSAYYGTITSPGGVVSTAKDMARWLRFHIKEGLTQDDVRLVNRNLMRDTHRPAIVSSAGASLRKPRDGAHMSEQKIALGWREGHYEGYRMSSHSGNLRGWLSLLSYLRDMNMGVFLSINGPHPNVRPLIHSFIYDLLMGKEPWIDVPTACARLNSAQDEAAAAGESCSSESTLDTNQLSLFAGTYGHFGYGNISISLQNDQLVMRYGPTMTFDLKQRDNTENFDATGREPFWFLKFEVTFEESEDEMPPDFVTVSFEPEIYPTFERNLKLADAPPPSAICPDT